jgi:hypothetical protein
MWTINRLTVGIIIALLLIFLIRGIWSITSYIPDYEPFGYGASGVGIVGAIAVLGGIVVVMFSLMIAWYRLGKSSALSSFLGGTTPKPLVHWLILSVCGWMGTFLTLAGIARAWNWQEMAQGLIILVVASLAAFKIARTWPSDPE